MNEKKILSELWNCPAAFEFQCPREWKMLARTDDPAVRHCSACAKDVYLCRTPQEFVERGSKGHCVAVPTDLSPRVATRFLMGRIAPEAGKELAREQKEAQEFWNGVVAQSPGFEKESLAALVSVIKSVQAGNPA